MSKSSSTKIKAVLFDLGKVIVDFSFHGAFRRLSRACSLTPDEIEIYFLQSGLEVLYDGGKITSRQFYSMVKKALRHKLSYDEFSKIWNEIFTENPKTSLLIKALKKKGYRLVLISNTNDMHYRYIRETYPILGQFDKIILSYKEKLRKPDAGIYKTAMRACKAKPHEILYIDDRADLTEAATELGIHSFTFRKNYKDLRQKMKELGITV